MPEDKKYRDLELKTFIRSYHPSSIQYNALDGLERKLRMEGHVDDPFVGPMGDIFPNEEGSKFSWAPIEITLSLDTGHVGTSCKRFGSEAIGVVAIKKNVEIEKFNLGGESHIDHPVKVYLSLPEEAFIATELTLKECHNSKKLALLQLELKVTSEFIRPEAENYTPELPLPLKEIDVTKSNLEMGIFGFSFNATIIDKEDD